MAKGMALHIGVNSVDPKHYGGWSGPLTACEADALDMAEIAKAQSFADGKLLLTKEATRDKVLKGLDDAAKKLAAGDLFLLTYSGHGGQIPDLNDDEPDTLDETWCLFDGELVDDELFAALGKFAEGVRIFMLSDSCHSGSVMKLAHYETGGPASGRKYGYRAMPPDVQARTYQQNRKFYDPILTDKNLKKAAQSLRASAILISGCQDNQLSADGAFNGLFTGTLKAVWNGGKFNRKSKNYRDFHKAILSRMPPDQTPNFFTQGPKVAAFEKKSPFAIG